MCRGREAMVGGRAEERRAGLGRAGQKTKV